MSEEGAPEPAPPDAADEEIRRRVRDFFGDVGFGKEASPPESPVRARKNPDVAAGAPRDVEVDAARSQMGDELAGRWLAARTLADHLPTMVGNFRIESRIGKGGMGVVCRAVNVNTGRPVAVKFVPKAESSHARTLLDDVRAMATIQHPNVVSVLERGETADYVWVAMELVEGKTLAAVIADDRASLAADEFFEVRGEADSGGQTTTPIDRATNRTAAAAPSRLPPLARAELIKRMTWFRDLARAIRAVNRAHLIHRDIKPANIMIDAAEETPVLIDFGLAIDDEDSIVHGIIGTTRYMSPEQAKGCYGGIDGRSDVYALAITFYETLTGRLPTREAAADELLDTIVHRDPPPPSTLRDGVPASLDPLFAKALAKMKSDRFNSTELVAAIESWMAEETGSAPISRAPRRRGVAAAALIVLLSATIAATIIYRGHDRSAAVERGETAEILDSVRDRIKNKKHADALSILLKNANSLSAEPGFNDLYAAAADVAGPQSTEALFASMYPLALNGTGSARVASPPKQSTYFQALADTAKRHLQHYEQQDFVLQVALAHHLNGEYAAGTAFLKKYEKFAEWPPIVQLRYIIALRQFVETGAAIEREAARATSAAASEQKLKTLRGLHDLIKKDVEDRERLWRAISWKSATSIQRCLQALVTVERCAARCNPTADEMKKSAGHIEVVVDDDLRHRMAHIMGTALALADSRFEDAIRHAEDLVRSPPENGRDNSADLVLSAAALIVASESVPEKREERWAEAIRLIKMALPEAPELIDNVVAAAACVPSWRAGYETIMRLFDSELGKKVPFDRSVGRLFAWVTSEITDAISENGDLPADTELADRTLEVARVFRRVAPTTEKMPPEFLENDLMMIRSAEAWVQFRRAKEYAAHQRSVESRALLDAAIGSADEEWRRIKAPGGAGAARGFEVWLVLALARAEEALGAPPTEPNRKAIDAALSTLGELLDQGRRRALIDEVQRLFPERKISIEANLRECEEIRDRLIRSSKN